MQTREIKQANVPKPRWMYTAVPDDEVAALAAACNVALPVAQVLWNRGYTTAAEARRFLEPQAYESPDPYLMGGMDVAIARLLQAIAAEEPIVVYGDYDVDGQVSVAVLVSVLQRLGGNVTYYVPHRLEEGYGLTQDSVARVAKQARLMVTVDCGITSVEEVAYARELGVDCIITDHHEPGPDLPEAAAILNPKQRGCLYPEKQLAGCGVVYTLVRALYAKAGVPPYAADEWLDLVALGTVADVVPLQGENRALVAKGLPRFGERPGMRALCTVAGVDCEAVTAGQIGFRLGPRLNAAGRLADAGLGVRLLLTHDEDEAMTIATTLNEQNEQRQRIEQRILDAGHDYVAMHARLDKEHALVVAGEQWHRGVIGIVASRLVETYGVPTLVISIDGEEAVGSGRSIPGFDLHGALSTLRSYFSRFGGHRAAAGFSLPAASVAAFRTEFIDLANRRLAAADLQPAVRIDAVLAGREATADMATQFTRLAPFGYGNPEPVVAIARQKLAESRAVGRDQAHWRLTLADPDLNNGITGVGFGMAPIYAPRFGQGVEVDVAGSLSLNEWQGRTEAQLRLRDVIAPRGEHRAAINTLLQIGAQMQSGLNKTAAEPDAASWQATEVPAERPLRLFDARNAVDCWPDAAAARRGMVRHAWGHADVVLVWLHGQEGLAGGVQATVAHGKETTCYVCCGTIPPTAAPAERGALVLWSVPTSAAEWLRLLPPGLTWARQLDVYAAFTPHVLEEAKQRVAADLPVIDTLRTLYVALQRQVKANGDTVHYSALADTVTAAGTSLSPVGVRYGLSVFAQAGLLQWTEHNGWQGMVQFSTAPAGKVDLTQVVRYNEGEQQRHDILAYFEHIQHTPLGDIIAPLARRAVTSS